RCSSRVFELDFVIRTPLERYNDPCYATMRIWSVAMTIDPPKLLIGISYCVKSDWNIGMTE
ncbi:MAG TPA: hypothetical protein VE131_03725, partial [Terriglobales bacterium]|nr:hypothetical protein [Terriglobales bacterium]